MGATGSNGSTGQSPGMRGQASSPALQGLAAQVDGDCRVLVLGSMPGAASLHAQRYYAHPRNRFWPLLGGLCGFDATLDYPARLQALHSAGVGLWDVIGRCERIGSLDAAIRRDSEIANPLAALIARLPRLRAIALNGGKAAQSFRRYVGPDLGCVAVLPLPSTSPANAAFSEADLRQAWRVILPYLERGDE